MPQEVSTHSVPLGIAARLKAGTAVDHAAAEGRQFLAPLAAGTGFDLADFRGLTVSLQVVYEALEAVADRLVQDPIAGPFVDRRLFRRNALAADLSRIPGADSCPPVPAAFEYAARIRNTIGEPIRFVAHHYIRYLGDLSGGQVLRRWLLQQLPQMAAATTFYDFSGLGSPSVFKAGYRAQLDALPEDRIDALIDEARLAFRCNIAVFDQLHDLRTVRPALAG